jgi:hypothetical protein
MKQALMRVICALSLALVGLGSAQASGGLTYEFKTTECVAGNGVNCNFLQMSFVLTPEASAAGAASFSFSGCGGGCGIPPEIVNNGFQEIRPFLFFDFTRPCVVNCFVRMGVVLDTETHQVVSGGFAERTTSGDISMSSTTDGFWSGQGAADGINAAFVFKGVWSQVTQVPEPNVILLWLTGLATTVAFVRRRKAQGFEHDVRSANS